MVIRDKVTKVIKHEKVMRTGTGSDYRRWTNRSVDLSIYDDDVYRPLGVNLI